MAAVSARMSTALNAVCPYFTMFPLAFPQSILQQAAPGSWVLDPFSGRGTTNYAARLLGLPSLGLDSSPVAVALSRAKLANASPGRIVAAARRILREVERPQHVPEGDFWRWAFHEEVLALLCRLREGLLHSCESDARVALRAVLMGALHGPRPKSRPSYFSNQSPRTYAPKPRYAVQFWERHNLRPERIDVLALIEERARRYYGREASRGVGRIALGDSRDRGTISRLARADRVRWVVTSPPYYGMRTYIPDQWLRHWFVGGSDRVDYSAAGQVEHASQAQFAAQLGQVWQNVGSVCAPQAGLVVRFGAINDRHVDPLALLETSLEQTGWRIQAIKPAGTAAAGRRQALHFSSQNRSRPVEEHDVWAVWTGT